MAYPKLAAAGEACGSCYLTVTEGSREEEMWSELQEYFAPPQSGRNSSFCSVYCLVRLCFVMFLFFALSICAQGLLLVL